MRPEYNTARLKTKLKNGVLLVQYALVHIVYRGCTWHRSAIAKEIGVIKRKPWRYVDEACFAQTLADHSLQREVLALKAAQRHLCFF